MGDFFDDDEREAYEDELYDVPSEQHSQSDTDDDDEALAQISYNHSFTLEDREPSGASEPNEFTTFTLPSDLDSSNVIDVAPAANAAVPPELKVVEMRSLEVREGPELESVLQSEPVPRGRPPSRYFVGEPRFCTFCKVVHLAGECERTPHSLYCRLCRKSGHGAATCPEPEAECYLCKENHDPTKCTLNSLCHNCWQRGHHKYGCSNPKDRGRCFFCPLKNGEPPHHSANCTDLWRRYKLTVDPETGKRPPPVDLTFMWCYLCGGEDHFGDNCTYNSRRHIKDTGDYNYRRFVSPFDARNLDLDAYSGTGLITSNHQQPVSGPPASSHITPAKHTSHHNGSSASIKKEKGTHTLPSSKQKDSSSNKKEKGTHTTSSKSIKKEKGTHARFDDRDRSKSSSPNKWEATRSPSLGSSDDSAHNQLPPALPPSSKGNARPDPAPVQRTRHQEVVRERRKAEKKQWQEQQKERKRLIKIAKDAAFVLANPEQAAKIAEEAAKMAEAKAKKIKARKAMQTERVVHKPEAPRDANGLTKKERKKLRKKHLEELARQYAASVVAGNVNGDKQKGKRSASTSPPSPTKIKKKRPAVDQDPEPLVEVKEEDRGRSKKRKLRGNSDRSRETTPPHLHQSTMHQPQPLHQRDHPQPQPHPQSQQSPTPQTPASHPSPLQQPPPGVRVDYSGRRDPKPPRVATSKSPIRSGSYNRSIRPALPSKPSQSNQDRDGTGNHGNDDDRGHYNGSIAGEKPVLTSTFARGESSKD